MFEHGFLVELTHDLHNMIFLNPPLLVRESLWGSFSCFNMSVRQVFDKFRIHRHTPRASSSTLCSYEVTVN